jgi:hypothetical protein
MLIETDRLWWAHGNNTVNGDNLTMLLIANDLDGAQDVIAHRYRQHKEYAWQYIKYNRANTDKGIVFCAGCAGGDERGDV